MDKSLLMEKVIAGKATPEEQRQFDEWLSLSDANRQEFEMVKWLTENADNTERDPDDPFYDGWKKIKGRMASIQRRRKLVRTAKIAVGVIVFLTVLYFIFHQLGLWNSSNKTWSSCCNSSWTLAERFSPTHASDCQI